MTTPLADLAAGLEMCARAVAAMAAKHEPAQPAEAYTIAQAARMLGISRPHLYEQARTGQLKVLRIGKAVRVPAGELDAFQKRRLR